MGDKYLSVITNFGCHFTCPYCVTKNNDIGIPETTLEGLIKLYETIKKSRVNIVSVSGGGDPLYNYDHVYNKIWYESLFRICRNAKVKFEMHTSYIISDFFTEHADKCYRIVYHMRDKHTLSAIRRHGEEIVRVVFVVTEDMTKEDIDYIAEYCKNSENIDELSFRQMIDKNYETTYYHYDYLKEYHKDRWWYIEQNDYNLYYAENETFLRFEDMKNDKDDVDDADHEHHYCTTCKHIHVPPSKKPCLGCFDTEHEERPHWEPEE